jgi:hypothetical protein
MSDCFGADAGPNMFSSKPDDKSYREILDRRLLKPSGNVLDARATLVHFAIITYALPKLRLDPYVPPDRFEIPEFRIDGTRQALLSAVTFYVDGFRFVKLAPFIRFRFGQTNYRAYVIDRKTGEHAVWFFGTTLGSPLVYLPRALWNVPWHSARYSMDCRFNRIRGAYDHYRFSVISQWSSAQVEIEGAGELPFLAKGFSSADQMKLVLTHPAIGFYRRLDGKVGSYAVWHEEMEFSRGVPRRLYFGLFEKLGLLSAEEMTRPHSLLLCPEVVFEVYLPPKQER